MAESVARAGAHALVALGLVLFVVSCAARPRCDGVSCPAACPRDAVRDASGRCACVPGAVEVLGACVPPAVGDAYCGAAARFEAEGCVFRPCSSDEALDAVTGRCIPKRMVGAGVAARAAGGAPACEEAAAIVARRELSCVEPDATCPRGTRRSQGAGPSGPGSPTSCVRSLRCPPGSLPAGDACQSVVTIGSRDGVTRVDLGAWAALVVGADGGPGSEDLCRPLALRPDALNLDPGGVATVGIRIALFVADQDLTRVHARAEGDVKFAPASAGDSKPRLLSGEAEMILRGAVGTLVEPLRGLGGEASTALLEVRVDCKVKRPEYKSGQQKSVELQR